MKHKKSWLYPFLVFFSVLAALKMIFFAFGLDEEYQLVMAYRNVRGDRLFLDMWEPHQSSAFLCALLMKPWTALFGTTGIVVYLRLCGTLLHLGVSVFLYKTLIRFLDSRYAWLLALIYFNIIPKQIILPEFGIMQVWFYTLMSLFLARYYTCGKKRRDLVLAALSLVLNVLSYPSCLILFPFLLALLARFSGRNRWRDMEIVTLVCALCGLGYLGMLFTYTSPAELLSTLSHILAGDITHSLTPGGKILSLMKDGFFLCALLAGCLIPAAVIARLRRLGRTQCCALAAILACGLELFFWTILGYGYERIHLHLAAFSLAGLFVCGRSQSVPPAAVREPSEKAFPSTITPLSAKASSGSLPPASAKASHGSLPPASAGAVPGTLPGNPGKSPENCTAESPIPVQVQKSFLLYIMGGALLSLLAVTYLTDLSFGASIPHAMPAAFCGAILLILSAGSPADVGKRKWIYAALTVWCLTAVFGKGYTLRSGAGEYTNVLQSGGILRKGPAAGTISNYMGAYIYNSDYEDWQSYVQDGDKVLIMVDQVMNLGTIQYLFKDVEVSHFSIVNPTAYDERLLKYWEMYPEKYPNVIIVDCWYGQLMTDPEGWLMQYIGNEFGYTQVNDGKYIRIYRR